MDLDKKTALYMATFVAAVFVLALKFLQPVTINVIFGGNGPVAAAIPGVYTLADCVVLSIAAFLLGITAVSLFLTYTKSPGGGTVIAQPASGSLQEIQLGVQDPCHDPISEACPENTLDEGSSHLLNLLKGNERNVMEALMKYGEMNQADLSTRTGIPKSTLSRTLQNLEDRKLIFRYDNGMSKMVKLEIHWNDLINNNHH
ncbi:helix-turn-helix domain-containing protein [Methanoregula sp.]|uniref:helix-turn-helix transcriptional regulator n=1 Tax=Methanoregula sp. TaxID=2052170 RepID=UPI0023762619|nr:helix-turn-helix domain-containing protein [Methanoregula sp.]MDD1686282.1 MarR family transcriptional regulator [Methanoregula sp.]